MYNGINDNYEELRRCINAHATAHSDIDVIAIVNQFFDCLHGFVLPNYHNKCIHLRVRIRVQSD